MTSFHPGARPLLIGSLPMTDHSEAARLVFEHCPDVPLWVQLPLFPAEGMVNQFLPGLPGFSEDSEQNLLDTSRPGFDGELISFFEDYLNACESPGLLDKPSRFCLSGKRGKGFAEFLRRVDESQAPFTALKGQVTGPITFGTAVRDDQNRDIFYHDQLRDCAVKKLALNARWQAREFSKRGCLPLIFMDEPVLAGFGASAYITITRADVQLSTGEIAREIHAEGGLAGVHVCANTEWDMLLESDIDIISFDAFTYFDRFILYPEAIRRFLEQGKILAWGIVPTAKAALIAEQDTQSLTRLLHRQMDELAARTGIGKPAILSQSFITPSCGTGSLDPASAIQVLRLTREVSDAVR